jgi:putative (di)nucleoside polyphosphate hydrolase
MGKEKKTKAQGEMGYRPCVGAMLIDGQGRVWIGRRFAKQDDEGRGEWWQMPQGGIDAGEDARVAVLRELREETGVRSAQVIEEAPGWFTYDLPAHLIGKSWGGRYRGQTQKWFALRFTGEDGEIDLKPPGHAQEFDAWRWETAVAALELIVPFKRQVYEQVFKAFKHLTS